MTTIEEKLRNELKPLYQKLLTQVNFDDVCTFCIQWGKNFSTEEGKGILFVGKAVNSWVNDEKDINILFGDTSKRIFARNDQMDWINDLEGPNDHYNTKKSAFWRVIKRISTHYFPTKWYSNVAWSNLCKIAPYSKGGNPNDKLYYQQLNLCQQILSKEIEILSPKVVVMLTSGWDKDFLNYLNNNKEPKSDLTIKWSGYESKLYIINKVNYIVSHHPQGKNENHHVNAIIKLIDQLNVDPSNKEIPAEKATI